MVRAPEWTKARQCQCATASLQLLKQIAMCIKRVIPHNGARCVNSECVRLRRRVVLEIDGCENAPVQHVPMKVPTAIVVFSDDVALGVDSSGLSVKTAREIERAEASAHEHEAVSSSSSCVTPDDHSSLVDTSGVSLRRARKVDGGEAGLPQKKSVVQPTPIGVEANDVAEGIDTAAGGAGGSREIDRRELPVAQQKAVTHTTQITVIPDNVATRVDLAGFGAGGAGEVDSRKVPLGE